MSTHNALEKSVIQLAELSASTERDARLHEHLAIHKRREADGYERAYRDAWSLLHLKSSHRSFLKFMARCHD